MEFDFNYLKARVKNSLRDDSDTYDKYITNAFQDALARLSVLPIADMASNKVRFQFKEGQSKYKINPQAVIKGFVVDYSTVYRDDSGKPDEDFGGLDDFPGYVEGPDRPFPVMPIRLTKISNQIMNQLPAFRSTYPSMFSVYADELTVYPVPDADYTGWLDLLYGCPLSDDIDSDIFTGQEAMAKDGGDLKTINLNFRVFKYVYSMVMFYLLSEILYDTEKAQGYMAQAQYEEEKLIEKTNNSKETGRLAASW